VDPSVNNHLLAKKKFRAQTSTGKKNHIFHILEQEREYPCRYPGTGEQAILLVMWRY
jgi:hypothetical protein